MRGGDLAPPPSPSTVYRGRLLDRDRAYCNRRVGREVVPFSLRVGSPSGCRAHAAETSEKNQSQRKPKKLIKEFKPDAVRAKTENGRKKYLTPLMRCSDS